MYEFDDFVASEAQERGISYTRYADDLAFSSNVPQVLREMEGVVEQALANIRKPRLALNHTKTLLLSRKSMRRVTGDSSVK